MEYLSDSERAVLRASERTAYAESERAAKDKARAERINARLKSYETWLVLAVGNESDRAIIRAEIAYARRRLLGDRLSESELA